ncbi:MAG: hypothetical protein MR396_05345 [Phocaeicola sp.]|nr:hypothetical protein [Phocaeicola sp.]MDY3914003.1 hypothetical protein [Phocaeicola sp.]
MKRTIYNAILCTGLLLTTGCDSWIDNAGTPKETLDRKELNKPAMLAIVRGKNIEDGALTAYVKTVAGEVTSATNLALGAMVDEVDPTKVPNNILYKELHEDIVRPNSTATAVWNAQHNLLARAEELLEIEKTLTEDGTYQLPAVRAYAQYTGHLFIGYAYTLLANSFSDETATAGKVRIKDQWYSHKELYKQAEEQYKKAIESAENKALAEIGGAFQAETAQRTAYALLVKLYLQTENYTQAAQLWQKAYKKNDAFAILYNSKGADNGLYAIIGEYARDAEVSSSLVGSLRNTAEEKAVPTQINKDKNRYLASLNRYSPLIITDDTELLLIQAELILRGKLAGDALLSINEVIGKYHEGSKATSTPTLREISHLRRVYLAFRGCRITDYRRGLITTAEKNIWDTRKNKWIPLPELELK